MTGRTRQKDNAIHADSIYVYGLLMCGANCASSPPAHSCNAARASQESLPSRPICCFHLPQPSPAAIPRRILLRIAHQTNRPSDKQNQTILDHTSPLTDRIPTPDLPPKLPIPRSPLCCTRPPSPRRQRCLRARASLARRQSLCLAARAAPHAPRARASRQLRPPRQSRLW
jgi:hypothetical protein